MLVGGGLGLHDRPGGVDVGLFGELLEDARQREMGAMQAGLQGLPDEARQDVAASMQAAQG
jgi:hypothetical protein